MIPWYVFVIWLIAAFFWGVFFGIQVGKAMWR